MYKNHGKVVILKIVNGTVIGFGLDYLRISFGLDLDWTCIGFGLD